MKIMSMNVAQFAVLNIREGSWIKEIITLIKIFLYDNPDSVVFLYEIPKRFWKKGVLESELAPYEIVYSGVGEIHTVAIKCKGNDWAEPQEKTFSCKINGKPCYMNRYVELHHQSGISVLGIHAPLNQGGKMFLEAVEEHVKKTDKLIIVGDFNITTNKERTGEALARQKWLEEMLKSGYYDAISPAKEEVKYPVEDDPITEFTHGTSIDHVLVPNALKKKFDVKAKVFSQKELELSDHAVIIVEIDPKEKNP